MRVSAPFEPAIVCRDLNTMLAFYRDVLGMSVFSLDSIGAGPAGAARLSPDGYDIARLETERGDRLKLVAPRQSPQAQPARDFVLQRHGYAYLTYIVPDLRGVQAALRRAGAEILTGDEPVGFRPGVVELIFARDPEGNCLEFVERNDLAAYRPGGTRERWTEKEPG